MTEQERNMAKQIKEFLDKGIPKADIAKATEFSLEYIDSLLEKYSPKAPEKDQDSDIQSQLNFLKQQVQILQKKLDNKEFENVQLKQRLNTIQTKGANMGDDNKTVETTQGLQQWEYMSTSNLRLDNLNKLGADGWQFVDGLTVIDKPGAVREAVFMRPKPKKKEKKEPDYGYGR